MLNSCGQALSQGEGSEFYPSVRLGSNSPWLQGLRESLEMIGSTPWGHTCPDLLVAAQ